MVTKDIDKNTLDFKTKDGLTLKADAYGDPQNPGVVFAHGGGQTRHAWGNTAKYLAMRGWYALTLDLRGHGESSWSPNGHYEINSFVDDLRLVASSFDKPPAVVGASLGGISAMLAEGGTEENYFSSVVLVDIAPRIEEKGVSHIAEFMMNKLEEGFGSLEEVAQAVADYLPQRKRSSNPESLRKNVRLCDDGRFRWHWDPKVMGDEGSGREDSERQDTDFAMREAAAANLQVPTMLVRGKMSDVVSERSVDEFLALVPHAKYVNVTGAGHMVAGDQNDIFSEHVVEFLQEALNGDNDWSQMYKG